VNSASRQLWALLRVAVVQDFRSRNPVGGRRSRSSRAFLFSLVFYFFVGIVVAGGTEIDIPQYIRIAVLLAVAGTYVGFNILVEYQQILLAPSDVEVLYWRPIASRVLFVARILHVLLYVNILSTALLAVPSIVVAWGAPHAAVTTWLAFCVAGLLNATAATAFTVLLYSLLLRHVQGQRLHDALATLQVVMGIIIVIGYQAVGPALERAQLAGDSQAPGWLAALPAAWFAVLPTVVGWGPGVAPLSSFALGVGVTVACALYTARILAPAAIARLADVAADPVPSDTASMRARRGFALIPEVPRLQRWFGACVARNPLKKAGFDFFLANLRGDRRLKVTLLPVVAMPVALVLFTLLAGNGADPYLLSPTEGIEAAEPIPSNDTPAPSSALQSSFALFMSVYVLALFTLTLTRSLTSSPSWRAGWVFFAAPTRRFDRFYTGILWGVAYGLLLPAVVLLFALLLFLWREPSHVVAHLALPTGLAIVAFPLLLRVEAEVPFAREPARHERSRDLLLSFALLVPLGSIAFTHYIMRDHVFALIVVGCAVCAIGVLLWVAVNRSIRNLPHAHAFEE
jgi:hypothetical protein